MAGLTGDFVAALVRTTLYMGFSAVGVCVLLRALRVASPHVHRAAWACVVLQAWLVYPWTIPVELPFPSASLNASESHVDVSSAVQESHNDLHLAAEEGADLIAPAVAAGATVGPPTAPEQDHWNGSRLVALLWLCGVAAPAIWYVVRYARFVRAVPLGAAPDREAWSDEWTELLRQRRIRPRAELRMTANLGPLLCFVPFVYLVLVPRPLWKHLGSDERLAILRHELAHLTRGDLWKSLAIRLLALPQWFNPLVWWAVRRFDEAGEWACDDLAKGERREQHVSYAKALLRLGELATQAPSGTVGVRGGRLSTRVHRLIQTCFKEDSAMKKGLVYLCLIGLTAVHALRVEVVAEEQKPPQHERKSELQDRESSAILTWVYDVEDLIDPSDAEGSFDSLIDEIQSQVGSTTWGEDQGRIRPFAAKLSLVISQTQAVHEDIADWLEVKRHGSDLERTGLLPYRIEPPDVVSIRIAGEPGPSYKLGPSDIIQLALPAAGSQHLEGRYKVQPDGLIKLDDPTVKLESIAVVGLTTEEAAREVEEYLTKSGFSSPTVALSLISGAGQRNTRWECLVQADGAVGLGGHLGSVSISGMTIQEATEVIEQHLERFFEDVDVSLDILATNSKVCYIITQGVGIGDNIVRLPITGFETVLDAISKFGDLPRVSDKEIYVSRPAPNGVGPAEKLPIDWDAISQDAVMTTNYQLLPGDRLFIRDKSAERDALRSPAEMAGEGINSDASVYGVVLLAPSSPMPYPLPTHAATHASAHPSGDAGESAASPDYAPRSSSVRMDGAVDTLDIHGKRGVTLLLQVDRNGDVIVLGQKVPVDCLPAILDAMSIANEGEDDEVLLQVHNAVAASKVTNLTEFLQSAGFENIRLQALRGVR